MIRSQTGQPVSALSYAPEADARLCHRFFAAQGVPAVLIETAAGPSDSRGEMAQRVQFDLAALSGAILAAPASAAANSLSHAPLSPLLASANQLAGRACRELQLISAPRYTPAQIASARSNAVRLALALYCVACLILVCACGKTLAQAWRRALLSRLMRRAAVPGGYVSIRARRFPAAVRESTAKMVAANVARRTEPLRGR